MPSGLAKGIFIRIRLEKPRERLFPANPSDGGFLEVLYTFLGFKKAKPHTMKASVRLEGIHFEGSLTIHADGAGGKMKPTICIEHRKAFWRAGFLGTSLVLAALACSIPGSPPTATPAPPEVPAGWICYTNATYGFEVCYPPDSTFATESTEHSRIELSFVPGTNLFEKLMDVDSRNGLATCESPMGEGYSPGSIDTETRTINGLEFLVQSSYEGTPGNRNNWTGYSTERDGICVSLTGNLRSASQALFPTPPAEFDMAAESAVFEQIVATFRWFPAGTPVPGMTVTIPPGWHCYQNTLYAFEVCYPADALLSDETADHVRINLMYAYGTNLHGKWMDVDGRTTPPACGSPQASGYDPSAIGTEHQALAGFDFLVQSGEEGAAGSIYHWIGYSTERGGVCASMTGVLHAVEPGNYPTPPPLYDDAAERAVFVQIVNTFRWLEAASPTPPAKEAPNATFTENTNCRRGASTDHEIVTYLKKGLTAPIVGRNEDSSWWLVQVPGSAIRCWAWGKFVITHGDLTRVPFVESPMLGCWYQGLRDNKPQCVAPCPEGAKPGGVCEP
jgi:hypothetical protein